MRQYQDWIPVLSKCGKYYCSPACASCKNCLKSEYDIAVAKAEYLQNIMGDGWKIIIWENLGWYSKVKKGKFTVTCPRKDEKKYSITFDTSGKYFSMYNEDPIIGLRDVITLAEESIREIKIDISEAYLNIIDSYTIKPISKEDNKLLTIS